MNQANLLLDVPLLMSFVSWKDKTKFHFHASGGAGCPVFTALAFHLETIFCIACQPLFQICWQSLLCSGIHLGNFIAVCLINDAFVPFVLSSLMTSQFCHWLIICGMPDKMGVKVLCLSTEHIEHFCSAINGWVLSWSEVSTMGQDKKAFPLFNAVD